MKQRTRMFRGFCRHSEPPDQPVTDRIKMPGTDLWIEGRWVIGPSIYYPQSANYKGTCWIRGAGEDDAGWLPVIPETVGESVGRRDENGFMLFEGDIVEVNGSNCPIKGVVSFRNGSYCVKWKSSPHGSETNFLPVANIASDNDMNIVGTMFSTPWNLD